MRYFFIISFISLLLAENLQAQTTLNINGGPAAGLQTFSTNFPTTQNPISLGGKMVTATTPGVTWTALFGNMAAVDVVSTNLAASAQYNITGANDALAVLTGTWRPDQSASVTVGPPVVVNPGTFGAEFEIHLRSDPATGAGYEITWGYSRLYYLIARWFANGTFDFPLPETPSVYQLVPGDVVSATIVGSTITMYTNGVQVQQITDTFFTSGNPGFGFNQGSSGTDLYGVSAFTAQELD